MADKHRDNPHVIRRSDVHMPGDMEDMMGMTAAQRKIASAKMGQRTMSKKKK